MLEEFLVSFRPSPMPACYQQFQQLAAVALRLPFLKWQGCPKDSSNYQSSVLYFLPTNVTPEKRGGMMHSSVSSRGPVPSYPIPQNVAALISPAPGNPEVARMQLFPSDLAVVSVFLTLLSSHTRMR